MTGPRADTGTGFLYIASVSVIPELLEESRSAKQALKEVRPEPVAGGRRLELMVLTVTVRRHGVWCLLHGEWQAYGHEP